MKILGAPVEDITWIRVRDEWIPVADIWPPDAEGVVQFKTIGQEPVLEALAFQRVLERDIVMVQTKGETV